MACLILQYVAYWMLVYYVCMDVSLDLAVVYLSLQVFSIVYLLFPIILVEAVMRSQNGVIVKFLVYSTQC